MTSERSNDGGSARRLSAAAERRLVLEAQRGDSGARDRLVDVFLPSIGHVARQYRGCRAVDRRELMQEGVVGVLRALDRFDLDLGTPFWAYATWWVRQAMQQLVAELSHPIVLSDRALRRLAAIRSAERAHAQRHGHAPSVAELADEVGLTRREIERLIAAVRPSRGFDEPIGDGPGGMLLGDLLADPHAEDPYDRAWRKTLVADLPELLEELDERDRRILRDRFGLGAANRTLAQVGASLGISAERVRQLEQAALERLRRCSGADEPRSAPVGSV
ncbi:MAG TPA: sigma-70 family RNA polymerase sigma factor [Solirubrobacteraceae bacterium]|nr:sigma-70 family RNA polymerase sigma factor [Solirubrobacteraceae bacterium]